MSPGTVDVDLSLAFAIIQDRDGRMIGGTS
jgi:hypothetical protein